MWPVAGAWGLARAAPATCRLWARYGHQHEAGNPWLGFRAAYQAKGGVCRKGWLLALGAGVESGPRSLQLERRGSGARLRAGGAVQRLGAQAQLFFRSLSFPSASPLVI